MANESSSVILYRNVPLDSTYKVHFGAFLPNALTEYDSIIFNSLSWVRLGREKIRLSTAVSDSIYYPDWFYDYNYLSFRNKSKTYYAFITGYEYVNDKTVDILFEIDVLGSYWHEWSFQHCYIQREHVSTQDDTVGAHTLPEPVATGDYECIKSETINSLSSSSFAVIFCMSPALNSELLIPSGYSTSMRNGVISGCEMFAANATDSGDILIYPPEHIMNQLVGGVVNVSRILRAYYNDDFKCLYAYYVPTILIGTAPYAPADFAFTRTMAIGSVINGVTIKNGKTFTSPYMYLEVDNRQGNITKYKWELFDVKNNAEFWSYGTCLPHPCILTVPKGYAGINIDFDNANMISDFPQCAVMSEDISSWANQHMSGMALRSIGGSIAGAIAGASFGPIGALVGGVGGLVTPMASSAASLMDASHQPAQMTNSGGSPNVLINFLSGNFGFMFKNMVLKTDVLQAVDNFFTRYGYRVDRVGYPKLYSRERFNYVQNYETNIKTNTLPVTAAKKICEIFNAGITIWHTVVDFGDYTHN